MTESYLLAHSRGLICCLVCPPCIEKSLHEFLFKHFWCTNFVFVFFPGRFLFLLLPPPPPITFLMVRPLVQVRVQFPHSIVFMRPIKFENSINDHDVVMSALTLKKCRPKPVYVSVRSFKNYNPEAFCEDISNAPWSVINNFDDVNELNAFDVLFNGILDQHAPVRKVKVRVRPNPFVTEEIRKLMRTRNCWRKIARKTGDPAAWSTYRDYKRDVKRKLRQAQRSYVEQEIKKNPKDPGNMWKVI